MAHILPRRAPYVCKACRSTRVSSHLLKPFSTSNSQKTSLRQQLHERSPDITSTKRTSSKQKSSPSDDGALQRIDQTLQRTRITQPISETHDIPNPRQALRDIQRESLSILETEEIPKESKVQDILLHAQKLATVLVHVPASEPERQPEQEQGKPQISSQESSYSLLTELNEPLAHKTRPEPRTQPQTLSVADRETFAEQLAKAIYTLLRADKVFISEPMLTTYTATITTLSLPEYLPAIFQAYAHKPIPVPGSNPIKYRAPYSRAPKYAIPPRVTDLAVNSAIARRDLPLAIALIDLTVSTPQYFAAKFLRKAALPLIGASSVIPLSYSLSNSAAMHQLSWDPDTFFWMCMAGGGAYLGTMGTLLWITVTTWNDHHKRVRWVPGTPLGRRWFREEERMYFDRVAAAWGYQDVNRHGEETGEEWEALRELLGMRYMEVDRSSLLPGML